MQALRIFVPASERDHHQHQVLLGDDGVVPGGFRPVERFDDEREHLHELALLCAQVAREQPGVVRAQLEQPLVEEICGGVRDRHDQLPLRRRRPSRYP